MNTLSYFSVGAVSALENHMNPLELVRLPALMALTRGRPEVVVGLIDGPVALDHPDLAHGNVQAISETSGARRDPGDAACRHGLQWHFS